MECSRCKERIPEDEACHLNGKILCEDCYVQAVEPLRTCDVGAVYSAKTHRAQAGQKGTDGLTELQKKIYLYVVEQGRRTREQICEDLEISPLEFDKQMTILRHCELLSGRKMEDGVFIIPFEHQ